MSQPRFDLVVKNAQIADPDSPFFRQTLDIGISGNQVLRIGSPMEGSRVIDARGAWISPGWMDLYAVCPDPGEEWTEDLAHLARAAAAGGFTDVCVLAGKQPHPDQAAVVRYVRESRDAQGITRLHPLGASTAALAGKELAALFDMQQQGAVAFTNGSTPMQDYGVLLRLLQYAGQRKLVVYHFCLDQGLAGNATVHEGKNATLLGLKGIPSLAEELAVAACLKIATDLNMPVHISRISCAGSVSLVREAKKSGLPVSADVAALNLKLDDSLLETFDTSLKVMPPLRAASDRQALIEGLADGSIDAVVSNHEPRNPEEKIVEWDYAAFGANTLQTVAACMGELRPEVWVQALAHGPRRVLGLESLRIQEGMIADLTLFDPGLQWTPSQTENRSKSNNNPLWGMSCTGKALLTIKEGLITAENNL